MKDWPVQKARSSSTCPSCPCFLKTSVQDYEVDTERTAEVYDREPGRKEIDSIKSYEIKTDIKKEVSKVWSTAASSFYFKSTYSGCPNTGRPDFGYFQYRPVDKTSGFQVITRKPDINVRFSGRPVHFTSGVRFSNVRFLIVRIDQNRFGTGSKPVWNRFWYRFWSIRTIEIRI